MEEPAQEPTLICWFFAGPFVEPSGSLTNFKMPEPEVILSLKLLKIWKPDVFKF
jgi:hypothetical protein